ncbi:MAG: hypothetical protein HRU15_19765 [Planctomycetes bacterium]|nr:hypothetical protein [Planctomycetota bacterium]
MTVLAGGLVLILSTIAAILGYHYRRGRAAALLLASMLLLYTILLPLLPSLFIHVGLWGGLLCFVIGLIGIGLFRRRLQRTEQNAQNEQAEHKTQSDDTSITTFREYTWRILGAMSGIVLALLLCLIISLAMTWFGRPAAQLNELNQFNTQDQQLNAATDEVQADAYNVTDEWAGMRVFGSELASISGGLLVHIPVIGERTRYVQTMQLILLTPENDLQLIAQAHGLDVIIKRPCVQAAFRDKIFFAQLKDFSNGDLHSLYDLVDSAHVTAFRADPIVAATVEEFDIEAFTADLRKIQDDNANKKQAVKK